ncbi:MAG: hypothetical protein IT323_13825 [Anaerolineae bacterium]|nr:hypothetical protein [Anaerolineae bacterium]
MIRRKRTETLIVLAAGPRAEAGADPLGRAASDACLRQNALPVLQPVPAAPDAAALAALQQAAERAALLVMVATPDATAEQLAALRDAYQRAVSHELPCLLFQPPDAQLLAPLRPDDAVTPFRTAAELRAGLVRRLAAFRETDVAALHAVGDIPAAPEPYIAHPYTLIPPGQVAGRAHEMDLLTEWATATDHNVRIMNVVAIGGMGKSAMTWKWFNETAPQVLPSLAGRMWWSFYESDAHFENFIIRALAYVTGAPEDEIREITAPEREEELLDILDREPHLIVMDGIERILIAYARLDAARLDDDRLDEETANVVAGAIGLPPGAEASMFSPNRLRKAADPRAGAFLRRLAGVRASRILVSTRLYPADLQRLTGHPLAGSFAIFLTGLDDADALALWRKMGNSGEDGQLLPIFNAMSNYPLLIRALGGAVAHFRPAPGDFAAWRRAHPDFDPLAVAPDLVKAHVMDVALQGLNDAQRRTLELIAAFRMPCYFDALSTLLVKQPDGEKDGNEGKDGKNGKGALGGLMARFTGGRGGDGAGRLAAQARFADDSELDDALAELETRGLLGWDRRANRYDLHPIVRAVAWAALDERSQRGLFERLNAHFGALPAVRLEDVRSIDDLTGAIELFSTLVGLEKYDEAFAVYSERLHLPMLRRLSANVRRIELLEALFPDGLDQMPRLGAQGAQARCLNALALAYHATGQPRRSAEMYVRAATLAERDANLKNVVVALGNLSDTLRLTGDLRAADAAASRALLIARTIGDRAGEALSLQFAALVHMLRGQRQDAQVALARALRIHRAQHNVQVEGVCEAMLAQAALLRDQPGAARDHADRAWALADHAHYEMDYVRAARVQGLAALALGDLERASERLNLALTRARAANAVEYELDCVVALADLMRQRGEHKAARNALEDVWGPATDGPYRIAHADAYNVLTRLERDLGNISQAEQTANAAYYLSWCDGEPYAYQRGLDAARTHVNALGMTLPDDLPPFDAEAYGPFMEAELDLADEFGAASAGEAGASGGA